MKLEQKDKPKLVILGTGWGSVALMKSLNPGDYHVTVVSPVNYFLFTPMLPSATVGTLGLSSLVEPIRLVVQRLRGHFLRAEAVDVDFDEKLVEISQVDCDGNRKNFYLPYDKLVIGVGRSFGALLPFDPTTHLFPGSTTNQHGVKGLEHCNFLKSIDDARQIKAKVLRNLEVACLPTTSDEERKRLLSFVVCGGGPTGVEFAAELFDMLNEDLFRSFPRILRNEISVHLIQSRSHILNTYDETLSLYAEVCDLFDVWLHRSYTDFSSDGSLTIKSMCLPIQESRKFNLIKSSSPKWKMASQLLRRFQWAFAYGQLESVSFTTTADPL